VPKLIVIADDLSGATDVGVQFAKQGVPAFVVIRSEDRPTLAQLFSEFEVVLVNAESRHVTGDKARLTITTLIAEARKTCVEFFYKKTDSTLRGNVGAELDSLLKASGRRTLCFVPAHPALGRTTRNGVQFVNGTPLHESTYARDARNPVHESRIAVLLKSCSGVPITLVRQNELTSFAENPPAGMAVFDAETEADMVRASAAIRQAGCLNALAGPAALASCLPDLISFKRAAPKPVPIPRKSLVVNGSLNEMALRQGAEAERQGFNFVLMSPTALLSEATTGDNAREMTAQQVVSLLKANRDVVLASLKDLSQLNEFRKAGRDISAAEEDWPDRIAFHAGRIVELILLHFQRDGVSTQFSFALTVVGGDTLAGVARANSWKGFLPRGELLRGLAVCEIAERPGLLLVSKPGGFGDERALCAVRALGKQR
jgi:D-threonate/D-erythronate kinase